jgi:IS605 OrfB family transposase
MKLIAQVRLYPTKEQREALERTLERANAACDYISARAFEAKTFHRYGMQNLAYYETKERFGLSAQMVIRCLAKVADAYHKDNKTLRTFKPLGSIAYDDRILSWKLNRQEVSIWTLEGRQNIPFRTGERQKELLAFRQGETDLVFWNDTFFLLATCEIPDPEPRDAETALGADLGVANIATTNDGEIMSSETIEANRKRQQRLRSSLQARGSLSAKRHLRKLSGRQYRFQKDINHQISRRLVETAQRTNRAIALEDLKGIRTRIRAKGADQRARHSNWSFAQLRQFIAYKAKLASVRVILVDPRHTSQQCSACGHTEKSNRRSQAEFLCRVCGHATHADVNAAMNIARRAEVMPPIVSDAKVFALAAPETSLRLQP